MNRTDLINSLSVETLLNKKEIAKLLNSITRIVERTLRKGDKLQWSGLGTFAVSRHPERNGINPANKQRIKIPERLVAKFRPGKNLKEMLKAAR